MKKTGLLLTLILLSSHAAAQIKLSGGIQQGYEWNIFRNPEELIQRSDTLGRQQLWANSPYNEFSLSSSWLRKWKESRLRISGDLSENLYHQQSSAPRSEFNVEASYRINYLDNKYFEIAPEIKRRRQDGIDQNDLIFRNRLSFIQYAIPLHFDFYLRNKTWLKLETGFRYKAFDPMSGEETYFSALEAELLFKKKWEGRNLSVVEFKANFSNREQTEIDFETATRPERIRERTFNQYDASISYSISKLDDSFSISFPIRARILQDTPTGLLNYRQAEIGTQVKRTFGKVRISQSIFGSMRSFDDFTISDDVFLSYRFLRSTTSIQVPITNRIQYQFRANIFKRFSNRTTINSSAYRAFTNNYVVSGIRFNLGN